MEELEDAGWKATENKTDDEIKDIDMKEMFDEADQESVILKILLPFQERLSCFVYFKSHYFYHSGLHQIQPEHCSKSYWNCKVCKKAK